MRLIIVIDSDKDFLRKIAKDLGGQRHRVVTATSNRKGIELARTGNPDLILLGMEKEVSECSETMKELKRDDITKNIPVILTAPGTDTNQLAMARKLGIMDFLIKPYQESTLKEKIDRGLNKSTENQKRQVRNTASMTLARAPDKILITFRNNITNQVISEAGLMYTDAFFKEAGVKTYFIMDIRGIHSLEGTELDNFVQIANLFTGKNLAIVAGRHYGALLTSGMGEQTQLFLSPEELKSFFELSAED